MSDNIFQNETNRKLNWGYLQSVCIFHARFGPVVKS